MTLTPRSSKQNTPVKFPDSYSIMKHLKKAFKIEERVFFYGNYDIPADPLVLPGDHIEAAAYDVWKATGYRFT